MPTNQEHNSVSRETARDRPKTKEHVLIMQAGPTFTGKRFTAKTFDVIDEAGASLPKKFKISRSSQDGDQRYLVKHVEHLERF